jgi:hypothetical protein
LWQQGWWLQQLGQPGQQQLLLAGR